MQRILDNWSPTPEEIREWSYDENLLFTDQDEDLVFHQPEYVPIMMEIGSDRDCPKHLYLADILFYYSCILLLWRVKKELDATAHKVNEYGGKLSDKIARWKARFFEIYDIIKNPRPISDEFSDSMIRYLCVGEIGTTCEKTKEFPDGFIEYTFYCSNYNNYLYINNKTAYWKYSKFMRLDPAKNWEEIEGPSWLR